MATENPQVSPNDEIKQIVPPEAWDIPALQVATKPDFTIFVGEVEVLLPEKLEHDEDDLLLSSKDGDTSMIQNFFLMPAQRFSVNAAVMSQAGGAWPGMLDNEFAEGQQKAAWLREDTPQAMESLLKLLHLRQDIPSSYMNVNTLADVAVASDKYLCSEKIQHWVSTKWYQPIFRTLNQGNTITLECRPDKCALTSWCFKRRESFIRTICFVVEDVGYEDGRPFLGSLSVDPNDRVYIDSRLPSKVTEQLYSIRKDRLEAAGNEINYHLKRYRRSNRERHRCHLCVKRTTCHECSDDTLCDKHEDDRRWCSEYCYGAFLDNLEYQKIFNPLTFDPPEWMSLKEFLNHFLKAIKETIPKDNRPHTECISETLTKLQKRVSTLLEKTNYTFPGEILSHFESE